MRRYVSRPLKLELNSNNTRTVNNNTTDTDAAVSNMLLVGGVKCPLVPLFCVHTAVSPHFGFTLQRERTSLVRRYEIWHETHSCLKDACFISGCETEGRDLHSTLYFSMSWTSAMLSRRSEVKRARSCWLGAVKTISTFRSPPGLADVSLIPCG